MVGRKRMVASRIMIRINPGDRELIEEICQETGATISEVCRHWIADRAAVERMRHDNSKALKLMEGFLNKVQDEMLDSGLPPEKVAGIFGIDLDEEMQVGNKARPSNTGPNVSLLNIPQSKKKVPASPSSSIKKINKINKINDLSNEKQGR